jgi:DNA ligase-1
VKRFAQLFCALDQTTRTNEKLALLEGYFREAPPEDAAWALRFLCGRLLPRAVPTKQLWQWTAELAGLPDWLMGECYESVGDLAETIALLLRQSADGPTPSLARLIEERLVPLRQLPDRARHDLLKQTWSQLNADERLVWNKLITGEFRIGVARTLVIRALAAVAQIPPAIMAHRVLSSWSPTREDYLRLTAAVTSPATEIAQPYPFFLASPLELKVKRDESLAALGAIDDWLAEWKWDGIRAQLIRRAGEALVWSRGDEMVTEAFPEIVEASRALPDGTVLDGEILAWQDDAPLAFARLQRRMGRKQVSRKIRAEFPVAFVAYDLLELGGVDLRTQPLESRRQQLEKILVQATAAAQQMERAPVVDSTETPLFPGFDPAPAGATDHARRAAFPLRLSPLVPAATWEELARCQQHARSRGVEGLMLKRRCSPYGVGRQRGDWWKWKVDPLTIDAVLIAAQLGHGRRASLYTDYTFGVWDQGELVPIAKAYSGLTDEEIAQVDAFVRHNTVDKFGPARAVKPVHVFELAFEAVQNSTRHKSGLAVRFPRMNRWRRDKTPAEADTLENLRALARSSNNRS